MDDSLPEVDGSPPHLSSLVERLADRDQLLASGPLPSGADDPVIGQVRYDSRQVTPDDLFVARPGRHEDGHDHAAAAVEAGAAAVIAERPIPDSRVPVVLVRDARPALATAAAWRAGDPSRSLGVIGITGTDGKTTCAYMIRAVLEAFGQGAGLLSTTDVIVGGRSQGNAARTSTPEAPELQGHLRDMLAAGDTWAIIESSSHGLAQHRVDAVAYDVAVLTNVTSEHLEFHGSLEAYVEAKLELFRHLAVGPDNPPKRGKGAVVNADDPRVELFVSAAREAGAQVLTYGLDVPDGFRPSTSAPAVAATSILEDPAGMTLDVRHGAWRGRARLSLAGRFNAHNALAALATAAVLDLDLDVAAAALGRVPSVPGRMQRITRGQPFTLLVDYAHTADSLAKVLDELSPDGEKAGRIAVFGSAGERDVTKRAEMGRVAGERCRLVILTDEDPRGEDRMVILEAIAAGAESTGLQRGHDLLIIPDRAEAIGRAITEAAAGDAVLLAGKGHEKTIEYADGDVPWDEAAVALEALASAGYG